MVNSSNRQSSSWCVWRECVHLEWFQHKRQVGRLWRLVDQLSAGDDHSLTAGQVGDARTRLKADIEDVLTSKTNAQHVTTLRSAAICLSMSIFRFSSSKSICFAINLNI